MLVNKGASAHRRLRQADREPAHMHLGALPEYEPAVIGVRPDLVANAIPRHEGHVGIDLADHDVVGAHKRLEMRGLRRELDLARTTEAAGDALLAHEALDKVHAGVEG